MAYGGYRSMWCLVMFDLPTETKAARKAYREFREFLRSDGFLMMQYSVYARHTPSEERALIHCKRVKSMLPPDGEVRIILFTDKQFERMKVYNGKMRSATEVPPRQISFF